MVYFFFYDKLTETELIKMINPEFEICSGFVRIDKYDKTTNSLSIDDTSENNRNILWGEIVNFNMTTKDVLLKIYDIHECRFSGRSKYSMREILTMNRRGETKNAYIIY
jgi:hypothetical protein